MIYLVYRKLKIIEHTGLNVVDTGIVKRSGDGNELPKTICESPIYKFFWNYHPSLR